MPNQEDNLYELARQRALAPQTSEELESFVRYDPVADRYNVRLVAWRRQHPELPPGPGNMYKVGIVLAISAEDLFLLAEGQQYPVYNVPRRVLDVPIEEGTNSDHY